MNKIIRQFFRPKINILFLTLKNGGKKTAKKNQKMDFSNIKNNFFEIRPGEFLKMLLPRPLRPFSIKIQDVTFLDGQVKGTTFGSSLCPRRLL